MAQARPVQMAKYVKMAHFQYYGLELGVYVWGWGVLTCENLTSVCHFYLLFHLCHYYLCHFYLCHV